MDNVEFDFQGFVDNKYIVKGTSLIGQAGVTLYALEEGGTLQEAKQKIWKKFQTQTQTQQLTSK